jgi:hypothetical protein
VTTGDDRAELLGLADELCRLSGRYRAYGFRGIVIGVSGLARDLDLAVACEGALTNVLAFTGASKLALQVQSRARDLEYELGRVLDNAFDFDHARARALARALSRDLTYIGAALRRFEGEEAPTRWNDKTEARLLSVLARLLPAVNRSRYVAEAQGNLGDCERWWQCVDQLVCLAIGMPRLAWMMWREERRGRV